jgi:hypothetical protein
LLTPQQFGALPDISHWHSSLRQGCETPTTLAIPAKGILDNSNLSIKVLVAWSMILFWGSSTNCLPHSRHLKFCLPLWILPFLTVWVESQAGQAGRVIDINQLN